MADATPTGAASAPAGGTVTPIRGTRRRIQPGFGFTREDARELVQSRDLFLLLVRRELQVRYKQTLLGVGWVILQPLVPALIFAVVFGALAQLPSGGAPYLLFAMSGLVIWGLFSGGVSRAGASLVTDSKLLSRVYFPRVLLPVSAGTAAVVDFLVGLLLLLAIAVAYGYGLSPRWLLIPVVAGWAWALAMSVGVAVSALGAYYRDFSYALPFAIQIVMYASPIVYSAELIPASAQAIYALNPVVGIVESFRWAILGGAAFPAQAVAIGLVTSVLLGILGVVVFSRLEYRLVDVV